MMLMGPPNVVRSLNRSIILASLISLRVLSHEFYKYVYLENYWSNVCKKYYDQLRFAMYVRTLYMTLRLLASVATLALLIGCASTGDLTRYKSSICEVHHRAMSIEVVPACGGNSVYLTAFWTARRAHFPHHRGARFSEDEGYYIYSPRQFRTHVCPECAKAYEQWVSERGNDWR